MRVFDGVRGWQKGLAAVKEQNVFGAGTAAVFQLSLDFSEIVKLDALRVAHFMANVKVASDWAVIHHAKEFHDGILHQIERAIERLLIDHKVLVLFALLVDQAELVFVRVCLFSEVEIPEPDHVLFLARHDEFLVRFEPQSKENPGDPAIAALARMTPGALKGLMLGEAFDEKVFGEKVFCTVKRCLVKGRRRDQWVEFIVEEIAGLQISNWQVSGLSKNSLWRIRTRLLREEETTSECRAILISSLIYGGILTDAGRALSIQPVTGSLTIVTLYYDR